MMVRFHEMLVLSVERPKKSWQTGKLRVNEDWGIFQRINHSITCTGRIPPKFWERESQNSSIRKENITRHHTKFALIAGVIWKGEIQVADNQE